MTTPSLSRRVFLKASGGTLVGTLAYTNGAIAMLAPERSWAVITEQFDDHQARTLLVFTRHLLPHDKLEDAVYALVVKDLDRQAADPEMRQQLTHGIATLDRQSNGEWLSLDEGARQDQVEAIVGSPFFKTVHGSAIVALYNNPLAFAHFGYGGGVDDSGYLHRGFDDIAWLPEPPNAASGTLPADSTSA
ncbi:tat (twin-arginine translocation) pathway signal sequence [Salinicola corii]|nr:tat (twin-arginine translocation) pathway signal sequence [Salinicola corii]